MVPEANIISGKASIVSINETGGSDPLSRGFRGQRPLQKVLGSKEHLDWLKTDLIAVEIRTVQDYICTKYSS